MTEYEFFAIITSTMIGLALRSMPQSARASCAQSNRSANIITIVIDRIGEDSNNSR